MRRFAVIALCVVAASCGATGVQRLSAPSLSIPEFLWDDYQDETSDAQSDTASSPSKMTSPAQRLRRGWADLRGDRTLCEAGHEQSPIDLGGALAANAPAPAIAWSPTHAAEVINTGYTIQVAVEGAGGLTHAGETYGLTQVHFHHPAEHAIDGRHASMEMQFVHESDTGAVVVVGVLIEHGAFNPALAPLWNAAPVEPGRHRLESGVDLRAFLPTDLAHFQYRGALTDPPCDEIVTWMVLRAPIQASAEQIGAFAWLFPNNARPLQPVGRRFVLFVD